MSVRQILEERHGTLQMSDLQKKTPDAHPTSKILILSDFKELRAAVQQVFWESGD